MNTKAIGTMAGRQGRLGRIRVRAATMVLVGVLGSLVAAAPASAYLRDFKVVPDSTQTNSQDLKSGLVSVQPCGGVYFGGAAFVKPPLGNVGLTELMPFGGLLYGAAETDSASASWSVEARAFCAQQTSTPPAQGSAAPYIKGVQIVREESSGLNSAPVKTAIVKCPAGKSAISGGGAINAATSNVAFTSMQRIAGGTSWRVTAHEVDSTSVNWKVEARAVCANITTESPYAEYVGGPVSQVFNPPLPLSSSSTKTIVRTCPPGTYLVGGGARVLGPGFDTTTKDVVITRSQPLYTGISNKWVAEARETDPISASWALNAYIACAPLNAGPPA
jgi:hypothetical protein